MNVEAKKKRPSRFFTSMRKETLSEVKRNQLPRKERKERNSSNLNQLQYSDGDINRVKREKLTAQTKSQRVPETLFILDDYFPEHNTLLEKSEENPKEKRLKERRSSVRSTCSRIVLHKKKRTLRTLAVSVMAFKRKQSTSLKKKTSRETSSKDLTKSRKAFQIFSLVKQKRVRNFADSSISSSSLTSSEIANASKHLSSFDVLVSLNLPEKVSSVIPVGELYDFKNLAMFPDFNNKLACCIERSIWKTPEISPGMKKFLIKCCRSSKYKVIFEIKEKSYILDDDKAKKYFRYCMRTITVPTLFVDFGESF